MASGAARRARKRANASVQADVARIRALRAMAEREPVREAHAVDYLPNGHRTTPWAKGRFDSVPMHTASGNGGIRYSDMPRNREASPPETYLQRQAREAREQRNARDRARRERERMAQCILYVLISSGRV